MKSPGLQLFDAFLRGRSWSSTATVEATVGSVDHDGGMAKFQTLLVLCQLTHWSSGCSCLAQDVTQSGEAKLQRSHLEWCFDGDLLQFWGQGVWVEVGILKPNPPGDPFWPRISWGPLRLQGRWPPQFSCWKKFGTWKNRAWKPPMFIHFPKKGSSSHNYAGCSASMFVPSNNSRTASIAGWQGTDRSSESLAQ